MIDWWAAISIGLVSSFHCLGMCGPIAFAVPALGSSSFSKLTSSVLYNGGRIVTYIILGVVFGLLGKSLVIAGAQRWLSIGAGVFMIASVVLPKISSQANFEAWSYSYIGQLKGKFIHLFQKNSVESIFSIGLLNGLLPCAMVYIALAGAISQGDWSSGGLFMMFFGLGTLPIMFSASILGNLVTVKTRNRLQQFIPYLVVLIGFLFILRGMDLGIHYLSPQIDRVDPAITDCD